MPDLCDATLENTTQGLTSSKMFRVPSTILCSPSTVSDDEDSLFLEDESRSELDLCLGCLQSCCVEDNQFGMERLVRIVNAQLVDSTKEGSLAVILITGQGGSSKSSSEPSHKLQALQNAYISYFPQEPPPQEACSAHNNPNKKESDSTSDYSFLSHGQNKSSLRLPALQVLLSSLRHVITHKLILPIDTSSIFWTSVPLALTKIIQDKDSSPIEALLALQSLEWMRNLSPEVVHNCCSLSILRQALHEATVQRQKLLIRELKNASN